MSRKTISNTFTVSTVEDGESAPYYFQEWFAWSNNSTTASVTTAPTIAGSWATSIPAQGSYAYLWRKSIRYVWNDNTRQYTSETPQYFRMSGTNGTSITPKGNALAYTDQTASSVVPNPTNGDVVLYVGSSHEPDNLDKYEIYDWSTMAGSWEGYVATDGDSYVLPNGHLMMFSSEADDWIDLGQFQGQSGKTYYTHVAWATNVDTSTTPITVTDFVTTKSPNDTTHIWMGVLVDQNSGQDSSNATLYTWSNTKGNKGDNGESAAIAHASTEQISIPCNSNGFVSSQVTVAVSFSMRIGSVAASNIRVNNPSSLPTGVQYSGTSPIAGNIIISTNATASGMANGLTFTVIGSDGTKDYTSTVTIALIGVKQGSTGERGKVGRFFYFGGTFNPQDNDPTHVFAVNDAQAPYFEHTVDGQKRYHVFDYETNGSYTMAQMWSISNQSWSNAPWEVMTNDFKYIITEAIFGSYAHFGSAIINGDWMLSQHGVIYDTSGNAHTIDATHTWTDTSVSPSVIYSANNGYTLFDADYPNESKPNAKNFVPNYCVDLLTGKTYQNSAVVRGTVYADSGYFNGSLRTIFHNIANDSGWFRCSSDDPRIQQGYGVGWNYLVGDYDNMCMLARKTIPSGGTSNNLHVRLPNTLSMIGRRIILYEMNQPPFSDGTSFFEIRQLNHAAFVGVSAGGHGLIDFQAVYGISICGGVVEFLAVPHPTDATICTWAITNIDGCIWDYTTTQ